MIELLSPAGNIDCVKAAVQNGANAIYLGANNFSARAFANNFTFEELKKAIEYCKLRGVKTNLTLNTLITDEEFNDAVNLAKTAYEFGIDAIIIQDLGLSQKLIEIMPDLPIHASTQMSIHNLEGVLRLEKLGFKRVVLARELSIDEISYICSNTKTEIECFIHGALCISYSGQCLFSSMIGGRSGNRGKCAQPCRLPYELRTSNDTKLDHGHLMSPRDLCALEYIPNYIKHGVASLKIEGRMKSPEYVATVTRIYRKYIDLAYSNEPYIIDEKDKKELLQVFNRGSSSNGHLNSDSNTNLICKEKPNNMGLFLGIISKYSNSKGHITLKLNENIEIGDTISLQNETGTYTISEIMDDNRNIIHTKIGQTVTLGRMKGNIKTGDKVFKISSKSLIKKSQDSFSSENTKAGLNCNIIIKKDTPISIKVTSANKLPEYKGLNISYTSDTIPELSINKPLTSESVIKQISKTNSTPFEFKKIDLDLDDGLFLPKLSVLNDLRRSALELVECYVIDKGRNTCKDIKINRISREDKILNEMRSVDKSTLYTDLNIVPKVSVLLNILETTYNYSKLEGIDNLYIPLKYFFNSKYEQILSILSENFDIYIYMPTVVKENYRNLFLTKVASSVEKYNIKGFIISNISNIHLLNNIFENPSSTFKLITNYTFNVFNTNTTLELKKLGATTFTISPELNSKIISKLCDYSYLQKEIIVYGKTPVMQTNYCFLGSTNKCYPSCSTNCKNSDNYYLKDRLNMNFLIIPDNVQTITTIYNSKILSILPNKFNVDSVRIDIIDETINEINNIIKTVRNNERFEGNQYTNGNLNREL